jgi:hypothetical protein
MLEHPLSPPRHHEYQSLRSSSTSPSSSQTLPFPEPSPSPGRPSSQSLPPSPPPSPPYPNNNTSTTNSIAEEADVDAMPPLPRVGYRSYLPKMPLPNRPSLSWRRGFRSSPTLAEAHRNASSPIELKSPGAEGGNGGAGGGEQKKRKRRGMRCLYQPFPLFHQHRCALHLIQLLSTRTYHLLIPVSDACSSAEIRVRPNGETHSHRSRRPPHRCAHLFFGTVEERQGSECR